MDERRARLLVNPVRQPDTDLCPAAPPLPVLTSEAPPLALDGPGMAVLTDEWRGDRRMVRVSVTTSMRDRVWIIIPKETPLLALTLR